jgi:hypothetical protein
MDLDGIDFEAQDPAELETAQALMAIETLKPLTLEQIETAFTKASEASSGPAPELVLTEADGIPVLEVTGTQTPGGVDKAYVTVSDDGKTVLWSFNVASLKSGLARLVTGTPAAMSEEMKMAARSYEDREIFMAVILPASVRAMIQQGVQGAGAQGGMGAMFMPFATMSSVQMAVDTAENMDFSLSLDLGNPGNAQQAAGMLQSMLPMVIMSMQQQAGPEAMSLMNKLSTTAEEGSVKLGISLTPAEAAMIFSKAAPALPAE